MDNQLNIFDVMYPKYKITKPIRLIELFAGYGSQALALKYLGISFEHWKICEWAVKSIQAYKDIHFTDVNEDRNKNFKVEDIRKHLYNLGISSNYNEPMTKQQIDRLSEKQVRQIHNNICITNNLVNIQQAKGKDLEIEDIDKYDYILTYSFPCQDLSLAGKGKGMSDTTTRSGMLWEVERILTECYELKKLPQILLMENVPQIHNQDNIADFHKWQVRLEELGYKNYWQDLIATNYGIPQTRNRCFMVSILGDYSYTFPKPIPLKLKLKDMLEDNVDEKYYLSDKMIKYIYSDDNSGKYNRKTARESCDRSIEKGIAVTITTTAGNRPTDNFIISKHLKERLEQNNIENGVSFIDDYNRTIKNDGAIATLSTKCPTSADKYICIKNGTKQGYLEATDGDGIDLTRPNSDARRGRVQKEAIQTLTTQNNLGVVNSDLRIRKLTPRECFRLMGVKDEDFDKVRKNQSDSSLYHLAGDSIVVNVLMTIFKEMIK